MTCSTAEEISREEYDADIAEPLRKMFKDRGWWTLSDAPDNKQVVSSRKIQFVALIKGMPLKIRPTTECRIPATNRDSRRSTRTMKHVLIPNYPPCRFSLDKSPERSRTHIFKASDRFLISTESDPFSSVVLMAPLLPSFAE